MKKRWIAYDGPTGGMGEPTYGYTGREEVLFGVYVYCDGDWWKPENWCKTDEFWGLREDMASFRHYRGEVSCITPLDLGDALGREEYAGTVNLQMTLARIYDNPMP